MHLLPPQEEIVRILQETAALRHAHSELPGGKHTKTVDAGSIQQPRSKATTNEAKQISAEPPRRVCRMRSLTFDNATEVSMVHSHRVGLWYTR